MAAPDAARLPEGRQPGPTPDLGASGARALPCAICRGCGAEFQPTRPNQVSCRPSCRARASRQNRVNQYLELRAGLDAMFGIAPGEEP